MRVMVAYSVPDEQSTGAESLLNKVEKLLLAEKLQLQRLEIPPFDDDNPLRSLVSWRLLPVSGMADALLCLDAQSTILRHPRKVVWLAGDKGALPLDNNGYLARVFAGGIREAKTVFASKAFMEAMRARGCEPATALDANARTSSKQPRDNGKIPLTKLIKALRG